MIIIYPSKKFKSVSHVWEEFYLVYDEVKSTKSDFDLFFDEMKDWPYGETPFFNEAMQIFETKYGRTWQEIFAQLP